MHEYLSTFLVSGFFLLLYAVNFYHQRRAEKYADEILLSQPKEYNKQIKSRANIYLVSRILWGLLFLVSGIYNVYVNFQKLSFLMLINFWAALFFIVWGVRSFRKELEKVISGEEKI